MKEFVTFYNSQDDDTTFLFEVVDEKLIAVMEGDYYHDKIDETIDGFFEGLKYAKVKFKHKTIDIELEDGYLYDLSEKEQLKVFKAAQQSHEE